jgi:hypothetical protein
VGRSTEASGVGVRPLTAPRPIVDWAFAVLGGVLGSAAILVTFGVERSRLPAQMAVHFGPGGAPNGWSDPWSFALGGVGLEAVIAVVFAGLLYGIGRSALLEHRYGTALRRTVLGAALLVSLGAIPPSWVVAFLLAAGAWPSNAPGIVTVSELANVLVIVGMLALVAFSKGTGPTSTAPVVETGLALDGVRFECPSCGEVSPAPNYWPFMPRLGVGRRWGGSSYYFRCPRCHEWGWERRVHGE